MNIQSIFQVFGTELVLKNDNVCSVDIVRCEMPDESDKILVPVVEVYRVQSHTQFYSILLNVTQFYSMLLNFIQFFQTGKHTCCQYNNQVLYPNQPIHDFDSCGKVTCIETNTGVEIKHEVIFENGCCNISGKMVENGRVQSDSLGQKYLCSDHSKIYRYTYVYS